jgi:hypothetical protein
VIEFHYEKTSQYRVVHVDGAIGGFTPRGDLHVALYSERVTIPKRTVHEVVDGELHQTQQDGKRGFMREIEVSLVMDKETAAALHEWLGTQLKAVVTLSVTPEPQEPKL